MRPDTANPIADRLAVVDAVTRVAVLADQRRWEALRGLFAEPVEVDYTALSGGEPRSFRPTSWCSGAGGRSWRDFKPPSTCSPTTSSR